MGRGLPTSGQGGRETADSWTLGLFGLYSLGLHLWVRGFLTTWGVWVYRACLGEGSTPDLQTPCLGSVP